MTFLEFKELTDYSATHIAHCLLYKPDSRPAKLAITLGYTPSDCERKSMRKLIAGKEELNNLFPSTDYRKAS